MTVGIHPSLDREAEALTLYAARVLVFPETFDADRLASLAPRIDADARDFAFEDLKDAVYRVNRGHASPSAIDQALLPLLYGTWHR